MRVNCVIGGKQRRSYRRFPIQLPDLGVIALDANPPLYVTTRWKRPPEHGTVRNWDQASESDPNFIWLHRHFKSFAGYIPLCIHASSRRLACHFLTALIACSSYLPHPCCAGSRSLRKLLGVRSGKMLTDQAVVFDDSGMITSVSPFFHEFREASWRLILERHRLPV
jgi:hypothetical protein